jgi:DNA mismatch repair protein MutS2
MNKKTCQKLEFNKIVNLLEEQASSFRGKELCSSIKILKEINEINLFQEQTSAAFTRLVKKGRFSFSDVSPVGESIKRLELGASLGTGELLKICRLLRTSAKAKTYGKMEIQDDFEDCLNSFFEQLQPLTPISTEIERCIISEDEISDHASSTLKSIRRNISNTGSKIHTTLNSLVNGSLRTYLQDALITMRGDRYCVPVKAEHRGKVNGLIHDQSSSGSTLFIEPMAVVKLNNDLKDLQGKEQEEIGVTLSRLSEEVAPYVSEISLNYQLLTQLDFIFARGALALSMEASRPVFNQEGLIQIINGRHPLLDVKKVVPISITLGDDSTMLIITGPNTGGKTVSLKTVGLFTLMGQAGLHIPASEGSKLAVFHDVFADIGDEQSIEQSLSTFSSHMTNIVSFIEKANKDSLVLFDELGAGTDPTEGAALAIAILSYLHQQNIRTLATTHYSELKVYALNTPGVQNACCEFDVKSLKPTYRLLVGIPGKSNAFAISGKLGLPDYIINDARSHISDQEASFEDLISDLETGKKNLEKEQEQIEKFKRESQSLKSKLEVQNKKIDEQKEKIINEAKQKANLILREAKELADQTISNFNKYGKGNLSAVEMEKEREHLRKKIKETTLAEEKPPTPKKDHKASEFKLGESVKVLSLNLTGTVSSLPDAKGNLYVQMGILRSLVHMADCEIMEDVNPYAPVRAKGQNPTQSSMKMKKNLNIRPEVNLLGKTVDEALYELDKYLDDAIMSNLPSVRVVHGKGTGALRNAVHNYLKKHKGVKSYRLGEFGEGDAGVTIVTFS